MKKLFVLMIAASMLFSVTGTALAVEIVTCWFPPSWNAKVEKAQAITKALADESGVIIRSRIANDYPEILDAFSSSSPNLVYVGSFVQAVIKARGLGTPLVQNIDGKELYAGIMVYPKGQDPQKILEQSPGKIAFAAAASSGESAAKAATGGKAAIKVASHGAACEAVESGEAKAAMVKNWWWESNSVNHPSLVSYEVPGISLKGNPDNVLTASKAVSEETRTKITKAALVRKDVFGANKMVPFDPARLDFSLELMRRGNIDPLTYAW